MASGKPRGLHPVGHADEPSEESLRLHREHLRLHSAAEARAARAEQKADRWLARAERQRTGAESRVQWLLVQQELWFAVTAVTVAVATGSAVFIEQCRQREACSAASRCLRLTALVGCAFVTTADAVTIGYYNNASAVCAPGETFDPVRAGCALLRPFPDALNVEAFGDRSGSCSEAACGAWVRGGSVPSQQSEVYMSSATHDSFVRSATDLLIDVASRPQLTASSMAATIQRCKVDAHGGVSGLRASTRSAYALLRARVDASPTAAVGAGALASGGCPSVANPSVFLLANGLQLRLADDVLLNSYHFRTYTDAVGEQPEVAASATDMLDRMNVEMRQHVLAADIDQYLEGYFGVGIEAGAGPLPTMTNPNPVVYSAATYYFPAYLAAAQTLPDAWRPLLYAMAASCARALEASVPTVTMPYSTARAGGRPLRPQRLPPAFLHHAPPDHHHSSDREVLAAMANATFRGIDRVAYELTSASSLGSISTDCVALGLTFHPEEQNKILFDRIVGARLYDRLERVVETLREGVMRSLEAPVARAMFNSTAAVRSCVNSTLVRIPGAPRNSWAGRSVAEPQVNLDSRDTVFEMVVKQASALLRERVEAVMTSTTLANNWIETSPTARNAFVYALAQGGYMLM